MICFLKRKWKFFCWLLPAGFFLGLLASWIFGAVYSAAANHPVPLPKNFPGEPVTFPSKSGATISGWLVAGETNKGVVILQHGVHGDKSSLVERAKLFSSAGYTVLMFDFQAHGESKGSVITFGFLESRDSQAAVEFVKSRFPGRPIGVVGESLGAAAAALAKPPLAVQALVLEIMYPTIEDATKDRIEMRLGSPARVLSYLLTTQIPFRAGCDVNDLRPLDAVAKITAPKLFLAGTLDRETKIAEARKIFENAAEPKKFIAFEGAHHQDLFTFAPEFYKTNVLEFLNTNLK
jgi:alpha-beta hydrolase superfamily lysophospholipase